MGWDGGSEVGGCCNVLQAGKGLGQKGSSTGQEGLDLQESVLLSCFWQKGCRRSRYKVLAQFSKGWRLGQTAPPAKCAYNSRCIGLEYASGCRLAAGGRLQAHLSVQEMECTTS